MAARGMTLRDRVGGSGEGMKARKSFLLRISPELYESLEAWAQQEFRSVNAQMEFLLKEAVRKHGRAAEPDPAAGADSPGDRPEGDSSASGGGP